LRTLKSVGGASADRLVDDQPPSRFRPDRHSVLSAGIRRGVLRPESGALIGVIAVYVFFVVFAGKNGFTGLSATAGWINAAAELGIAVVPVSLLLIAGEFDLSFGSVIACTTITIGLATTYYHLPLFVAIGIAFAIALAVGTVNGLMVTRTRLPSFIVTLASLLALAGGTLTVSRAVSGTTVLTMHPYGLANELFASSIGRFQVSVIWWVAITLLGGYVLTQCVFGNWILATGGEPAAAREAGIPTGRVKVILFMSVSLSAALVGTIQTLEFSGGEVDQGQSYVFNAIIASVIGGVLLGGGYGSAVGATLGAMTYGIVETGIYYTGWSGDLAQLILGILLLAAVLTNNAFRRLAERS
ncbi:MAG TPA: ABC transporter permease, partial [Chloroflexota bacterium]|nr:ABC transporter permease [Chloroflexota bacterium]